MKGSEELEWPWWTTCANVFLLQFKERAREVDEIGAKEQSSVPSSGLLSRFILHVIVLRR